MAARNGKSDPQSRWRSVAPPWPTGVWRAFSAGRWRALDVCMPRLRALSALMIATGLLVGCNGTTAFHPTFVHQSSNDVVVFIHGFTADASIWPRWQTGDMSDLLNADVYQFSYDTRLIDPAELSQTTDTAADTLARFLAGPEIGNRTITLVGHSQGGIVALRTLIKMPQAPVARVVLLGTPLFGSTSVPPDWLLPAPSRQLLELSEYSRALLELSLDVRDHLATRRNPPAIVNLMSRSDDYVPTYSAFVNFGSAVNIVTTVAHNALPALLTSPELRAALRADPARTASQPFPAVQGDTLTDLKTTLLIKAPDIKRLKFFYRMTADFDRSDAELEALGYRRYTTIGELPVKQRSGGRPEMTIRELMRGMSELELEMAKARDNMKLVTVTKASDGTVIGRTVSNLEPKKYAGLIGLPSSCRDNIRPLTVVWTKPSDLPPGKSTGERVSENLFECLHDSEITSHFKALGYDVAFQRQIMRRSPDGEVVIKASIPIGNVLARCILSDYAQTDIVDPSKLLRHEFRNGQLFATGVLTESERSELDALQRGGIAPPPPDYFAVRAISNVRSLNGSWIGDYLVIHNVQPGTYTIDIGSAIEPFRNGTQGDGLADDTESAVEKLRATPYRFTVRPGTNVVRLSDARYPKPESGPDAKADGSYCNRSAGSAPLPDGMLGSAAAIGPDEEIRRLNNRAVEAYGAYDFEEAERSGEHAYNRALTRYGERDTRTLQILCNNMARTPAPHKVEDRLRHTVSLADELYGDIADVTRYCRRVYAVTLSALGKTVDAGIQYDRAFAAYKRDRNNGDDDVYAFMRGYAEFLDANGRKGEAEALLYGAMVSGLHKLGGDHHATVLLRIAYADLMHRRGQHQYVDGILRELAAGARDGCLAQGVSGLRSCMDIGEALVQHGFNRQAEWILYRTAESSRSRLGEDSPLTQRIDRLRAAIAPSDGGSGRRPADTVLMPRSSENVH